MRKQTTTTDQTIDTARRPKVGHYLGFAFLAIVLVLGYSYLSWTSVNASSMLPKSIQDEISWVSEEKSAVKTVGEESTQKTDLRERLLDLRGKLGDSFGPVNALLSSFGFIALLYSINLQRAISAEQSRVQQESIKNQETTAKQQEKLQQRQRFEELLSITIAANRSALNDVSLVRYRKDSAWSPTPDLVNRFTQAGAEKLRPLVPALTLSGKTALHTIWRDDVEDKFREKASMLTEHNEFAKEIVSRYVALETSTSENETETKRLATAFVR